MVKSGGGGTFQLGSKPPSAMARQHDKCLWREYEVKSRFFNNFEDSNCSLSQCTAVRYSKVKAPFCVQTVFVQLSEVTMSVHFIVFPQVFPRHVTLYWDFATCQRWLLNFFLPQSISWPKSSYLDLAQETKWFVIKHVRFYNIKTGFELDKSKHLPQLWWWYIAA